MSRIQRAHAAAAAAAMVLILATIGLGLTEGWSTVKTVLLLVNVALVTFNLAMARSAP